MIDTWNVLHQTGILPPESAGIGLKGLIKLTDRSRFRDCRISLVCDGTNTYENIQTELVECIFTGPNRSADDEIIRLVKKSSGARDVLVITSDQAIIKVIKSNKLACLRSLGVSKNNNFLKFSINSL